MDVCEDLVVICPGWVGEVDGDVWVLGFVELGEEETAEMVGTGT